MTFGRIHTIIDDIGCSPMSLEDKRLLLEEYQKKQLIFHVKGKNNSTYELLGYLKSISENNIVVETFIPHERNPGLTYGNFLVESKINLDEIKMVGLLEDIGFNFRGNLEEKTIQ